MLTSTSPLQFDPYFCSVNAAALLPKDTVTSNMYILSFFYNTPEEIVLDSTDIVEIHFSDGASFSFNYGRNASEQFEQDSSACFGVIVSYECLKKMTKIPVSEIAFITRLYEHRIEIEDKMKLSLPNLAKLLLDKASEEYVNILAFERSMNVPAIVFDSKVNKALDNKYYGKYSGEWYMDEFLYLFDLYIRSDTSYIIWKILKDPIEPDKNLIKTQVLNIRTITDNNTLIMDVCYDSTKPNHTDGRRTFYLKLSEDKKMLYGRTSIYGQYWAEMYGQKKKKYRK